MTGVCVVMATHNSSRFIERALRSVDYSLGNRPHAVVIVDDASTDDTVLKARRNLSTARERVVLSMPKAGSVSASKNRAVKVARPFLDRYPWVAFMDDDDEMLPGRFRTLLERMEEHGQLAGVGDWDHTSNHRFFGDWSIHTKCHSPCTTIVHRSLIPDDGEYFDPVPPGTHEDMVTHQRMAARGVIWAYHGGDPVHYYHMREDSVTGGESKCQRMTDDTNAYLAANPAPNNTSIRSFCTVAYGAALPEAEILLKSLRLTGNVQPVVLMTDRAGLEVCSTWNVSDVRYFVLDDIANRGTRFPGFDKVYKGNALKPAAFVSKMDVIEEALKEHTSTLYLDADMVVLQKYYDVIRAPLALTPEAHKSACAQWKSSWDTERFGHYNAGCVYVRKDAQYLLDLWRRDFLSSWSKFGRDDHVHGGFTDQSSLDVLPLVANTQALHLGHNMIGSRLPLGCSASVKEVDSIMAMADISAGWGLYFHGWPLMTFHCHFKSANWHPRSAGFYRAILSLSKDPVHAKILELIGPSADSKETTK